MARRFTGQTILYCKTEENGMIDLKSMTLEEMTAWFKEQGQPAFRAKQVFQWLHRGVSHPSTR